jgi:hypothetical protein
MLVKLTLVAAEALDDAVLVAVVGLEPVDGHYHDGENDHNSSCSTSRIRKTALFFI